MCTATSNDLRLPKQPWSRSPTSQVGAPESWIATFADPDGNYLQLVSPMI